MRKLTINTLLRESIQIFQQINSNPSISLFSQIRNLVASSRATIYDRTATAFDNLSPAVVTNGLWCGNLCRVRNGLSGVGATGNLQIIQNCTALARQPDDRLRHRCYGEVSRFQLGCYLNSSPEPIERSAAQTRCRCCEKKQLSEWLNG